MTDGGKGSAPRPIPDWDTFSKNFDAIFGEKDVSKKQDSQGSSGQEEGGDIRPDSEPASHK